MSRSSAARQRERSEWLERAEAVAPQLAACADPSREQRNLAPEAVAALEAAGIFRMDAPREVGGYDIHPGTQVEVLELLSAADLSGGWISMIHSVASGAVGAHLPDPRGIEDIFGSGYPRVAGTANPEGRTRLLPDGSYQLDGRWSFASGILHSQWVVCASLLVEPDAPPRPLTCIVEQERLIVEDSWYTVGLEGSGSCHFRAEGLVVQPEYTMSTDRRVSRGSAWMNALGLAFLSTGHTGVALGAGKRALELLNSELTSRTRFGADAAIADRPAFQRDFGERSCAYEAARAYALAMYDEMMAMMESGQAMSPTDDARIRAMSTWVTDVCAEIVRFAHYTAGGSAIFQDHPLLHLQNDITAARQHFYVANNVYERSGRARLASRS